MKHPHYDLIVKWAQDTSQKVWFYDDCRGAWIMLTSYLAWQPDLKYHVGPTPPKTMRTLGGLEYPAPETEAPETNTRYYLPALYSDWYYTIARWDNSPGDNKYLEAGLVHLTEEAAEAHARAILAAIKKANGGSNV